MLRLKNIRKVFNEGTVNEKVALDGVTLTVEDGEFATIVGSNGAGKSTTMNIMTGYLGATKGEVLINGHDILKEPEEAKSCIGYLPEQPPLYMEMTVLEYLTFAAELKKIPKAERESQILRVMRLTKLDPVKERLIHNLSKGYKQRVGLAQAILGFPEIIILDEPTVGLDPKQIIEIRELIRTLAKKHTVILSSHILAEIREVCDHIMIIAGGHLVASDTPENLELLRNGASSLELEVKAAQETARAILSTIDDIDAMEMHSENENLTRVKLETKNGADIREAIFYAFAEEKCPLLEMKTAKASLEDIFMELTQKEESNDAGNL